MNGAMNELQRMETRLDRKQIRVSTTQCITKNLHMVHVHLTIFSGKLADKNSGPFYARLNEVSIIPEMVALKF